ncbi:enoyl-CoA hydratase/isomerase family protein [Halomarina ordinaria]|uniref:Enoyl-CoA hydratase/isomerase family protein n=1 Tax=Halomarina ordinaria TaxID=3033939 RepID=A0ABD5UE74_9EURY|nr:enoyl-CoA hydratase/isomerase family protein [Halomarina sp. PSRA2]
MPEVGTGLARVERDGHRADVVLNRPAKRNAMNGALVDDLTEAFARVADDESVRAVALLGEGPVFSAGMDLEMMRDADRAEHAALCRRLHALFDAIETLPQPVVVGIKRAAVAGAFELTLPADLRVLGREAAYGVVEVELGVFPHGGTTQRLPRLVGLAKAKELVYTASYVDPEEARRLGLVTAVCDDDEVDERTRALADDLTEKSPLGLQAAKRALGRSLDVPLDAGLAYERALADPLYATRDREEGFSARLDGREPSFEGR